MRATDLIVVSGDAHHRAALSALRIELIEGSANNLSVTPWLHFLHHIGDGVIEFQRIGNRHKGLAAAGLYPGRLIIVEQIAGIAPARLGKEIDGVIGVRQRRCQITCGPLTDRALNRCHGILDHLALLVLGEAIGVAGVIDTVAEELPVTLGT